MFLILISFDTLKVSASPVAEFDIVVQDNAPAPVIKADGVYIRVPSGTVSYRVNGTRSQTGTNATFGPVNYSVSDKPEFRIYQLSASQGDVSPSTYWTIDFYDGSNLATANKIGSIAIRFYSFSGGTVTPEPDEPSNPTPEPTPTPNYTSLFNIIIGLIESQTSNINITNTRLSSVHTAINSMNTSISNRLDQTNSNINSVNSSVNSMSQTLNNAINTMSNNISSRLETSNSHLNNIRNNLNTNKAIERNQPADWTKNLENNKPSQPTRKHTDNNTYFSETGNTLVNTEMPDVTEPKIWEGVEEQSEQSKDEELSSDSELITDNELSKDEFAQDEVLSKDEFTQDNQLNKDSEFSKDIELNKDDLFNKDTELNTDQFDLDTEFSKDDFDFTHNYEQTNEFEQSEIYDQTNEEHKLRWKSTNGKFH